ncbi:uncharacterized protein LOC114714054 [Neltuma alba]|uniref:uncharacterized protein LOC114714054 n=1 Tax=Neltuma alba TaxID=207710 RepID=UPI0010A4E06D|nr:uncharacterized protein LOC114714054 [Prosopis alba]
MKQFKDCIDDTGLMEVSFQGDRFTWERTGLKERLDWVFCNFAWFAQFPNAKVSHELKFKSDHRVVILNTDPIVDKQRNKRNFRYQAAWCMEESFSDVVAGA